MKDDSEGNSWLALSGTPREDGQNAPLTTTMLQEAIPRLNVNCTRNPIAQAENRNALKPIVQTLSIRDLDSCLALEHATFPEDERCSRERLQYRLTVCPELCLGLFSTFEQPQSPESVPTYASARSADSSQPQRRQTLIAMILATKTAADVVTEASMDIADSSSSSNIGHVAAGRTIGLHSLAVLPAFQKQGLARVLMRSYQQRMETSGIADQIALLAHGPMTGMYSKMGFVDRGVSETRHGGGVWNDMVYALQDKDFS